MRFSPIWNVLGHGDPCGISKQSIQGFANSHESLAVQLLPENPAGQTDGRLSAHVIEVLSVNQISPFVIMVNSLRLATRGVMAGHRGGDQKRRYRESYAIHFSFHHQTCLMVLCDAEIQEIIKDEF